LRCRVFDTLGRTDRVWFGYNCDGGSWDGGVGSIDVAAPNPTVHLQQAPGRYHDVPMLAAGRTANVLAVGQAGLSPASAASFAQAPDGTLTRLGGARDAIGSYLRDLAVSPNGATAYTAAGGSPISAFAVSDFTPRGRLPLPTYPKAIAVSPRGNRMVAASGDFYRNSLTVFRTTDHTRQPAIELGEGTVIEARGVAWSIDERRLYAVSSIPGADTVTLHISSAAAPAPPPEPVGTLPLPEYTDMAVGDRNVFVSGGAYANEIVATDIAGRVVRKIPGQAGASARP
jgi:DNA-binding beta-propeller fold protein YncE